MLLTYLLNEKKSAKEGDLLHGKFIEIRNKTKQFHRKANLLKVIN